MASRQKKKSRKALPHDPFEEMGELYSINPEDSGTDGEGAVTLAQEGDSDGKPRPRKVAAREVDRETKPLVLVEGETESAPESESGMPDPVCIDTKQLSGLLMEVQDAEEMDSEPLGEADTTPKTSDTPSE